jgi:methyl-accepting chemotaxis protein
MRLKPRNGKSSETSHAKGNGTSNVLKNLRIRNKTLLLFIVAGLIPMILVSFFAYTQSRQAIQDQVNSRVQIYADQIGGSLSTYFAIKQSDGEVLAATRDSYQGVLTYIQYGGNSSEWKIRYSYLDSVMPVATKDYGFDTIFLTNASGRVIYASTYKSDLEGVDLSIRAYIQSSLKGQENWSTLFYSKFLGHNCMVFSAPVLANSTSGAVIGTINFILNQQTIDDVVHFGVDKLGKTADAFLVASDGTLLTEMAQGQYTSGAALRVKLNTTASGMAGAMIANGASDAVEVTDYQNYAGVPVVGGMKIVQFGSEPVALVVEVNQDEAYSLVTTLQITIIIAVGSVVAVGSAFSLYMAGIMSKPVRKLLSDVKQVAKGDLTVRPEVTSSDEIGLLAAGFGEMITSNARLLGTIKNSAVQIGTMAQQYAESSNQVASTAQQLATGAEQIAKGATDQANAAQNTTSLMDQMTTKAQEIVQAAELAATGAHEDTKTADEGLKAAKEAQQKMNDINASSLRSAEVVKGLVERSKEIGQTANVITGIADQTNLLALNAAIEAARAGEHGRGFAVVAEEVRKLAEESKKAADQIAKLNDSIQGETAAAVKAIEDNAKESKAGVQVINDSVLATLQKVQSTAKESEATVTGIREASKKQMDFAGQVATAMSSVAAASEEASATTEEFSASIEEINASVEESNAGAQELSDVVKRMNELVNKYKVDGRQEVTVAPDLSPSLTQNSAANPFDCPDNPVVSHVNCWEFMKCGREPGGAKAAELGVCPASTDARADGINGGRNGGRACWAVAGTLCGGKKQGSFSEKIGNCMTCKFYNQVFQQQGGNFENLGAILKRIHGDATLQPTIKSA